MISSISNVKIKQIAALMKSAKKRRDRQCFIVEGPRMFFETPGASVEECYVTEEFLKRYRDRMGSVSYEVISDAVCRHISDTKTPQGVIAVVRRQEITVKECLDTRDTPCFFVLENLQDPGNMGTIIRTAEAAGVTGVLVSRGSVDPWSPKVIRSTMGAIFRVPVILSKDLGGDIRMLKKHGIRICAAVLGGEAVYRTDLRGACAFLIGNEGQGLLEETVKLADCPVSIPMKGKVESLNASVAAALLMYEVARQREW